MQILLPKMKKIYSLISRNFSKRVIPSSSSSIPSGISKQKPMKRTIIRNNKNKNKKHATTRKHLKFHKVGSHLISDFYMYNPLISPQPAFDFPPPKQMLTASGSQEDVALPIKGNNNKLIKKVVDYLEADCYLYSPLITNEIQETSRLGHFQTLGGSKNTETQGGKMQHKANEDGQFRARPVVTKTVAYRESVKHMVDHTYRTKPIPGA